MRKRKKKVYCFARKGETQGNPVPNAVILPITGSFYRGDSEKMRLEERSGRKSSGKRKLGRSLGKRRSGRRSLGKKKKIFKFQSPKGYSQSIK